MAGEHQYFYEDEVYRITKKGNVQFGMVLENSELVSSDENSDEEDGGRMKKGHIRVAWHPTGAEEVIPEGKVELADRSLMPGDVVRRMIKGKDTQRGYCRAIRVTACVQVVGSKQVITNVKSTHLVPLEIYAVDIAACLDCWVGGIKTVHSKITLQCSDGSRCVINDVDACAFENFCDKRDMDYQNREDFYPGQTLWGPIHFLENAEWINCTKEMKANFSKLHKTVKVVVEDVQTDSVGVHWQCRAYSKDGIGIDKEQPKFVVQGEDLKRLRLLNVFDPCTQQVGDRNFYTFAENDTVITKEQWRRNQRESVVKNSVVNGQTINAKRSPKRHIHHKVLGGLGLDVPSAGSGAPLGEGATSMNVDDQDDWDTEDTVSISDTASVSSGTSSVTSQGKKKRGPALMTKVLKKKKLRRTRRRMPPVALVPGTRVVVETLSTMSIADVVWQDGSVEEEILSTQLYPIHHLDDQEFFPGDFVIENKDGCYQTIYGVVQRVDHAGRTATVKWFKTYMSEEVPQPVALDETEVSVYDLKDHPDFQYRPGTVVIRVANFAGEHETCTAGQVLDNFPQGMVRVWWVDGHSSMSWPQDLYKNDSLQFRIDRKPERLQVGEYDSDEGELWDDGSSEGSWETESEDCFIAEDEINPEETFDEKLKPKLGANIEKARIAMARLEEIFMQNPGLQTTAVMRQLLEVYKDCRYLDKLMGTSFFHESHFQGLLERVRERGRANVAQRVADHVSRLFHQPDSGQPGSPQAVQPSATEIGVTKCDPIMECNNVVSNGVVGKNLKTVSSEIGIDSTPKTLKLRTTSSDTEPNLASNSLSKNELVLNRNVSLLERKIQTAANNNKNIGNDLEHFEYAKEEKLPVPKSKIDVAGKTAKSQTDVKAKHASKHVLEASPVVDSSQSSSNSNQQVCAKLCALIKAQLVKAHNEVTRRFGGNQTLMTLSIAANTRSSGSSSKSEGEVSPDVVGEAEASGGERITNLVKSYVDSVFNRLSGVPCEDKEESDKETDKEKVETAKKKEEEAAVVAEDEEMDEEKEDGFSIMECAPNSHKFKLTMFQPTDPTGFFRTVRKELKLLRTSLPSGIWVKGFEDRMDLYSVMIRGPEKTPYEDGLFFFDFQLSADYPKAPPLCHYISYCSDRLNPNLYEDGKVCISLLGTWSGKGTEVWSQHSNLLQVIISIQGLILVSEPYFNEAGYEKQKGSQQGNENSRMYNEMAVLKLVQAMAKMIVYPPPVFQEEILSHFRSHAHKLLNRLDTWLDISERYNTSHPASPTSPTSFRELHDSATCTEGNVQLPEFPLIPASKGFCLTLRKTIATFRDVLSKVNIHEQPPLS